MHTVLPAGPFDPYHPAMDDVTQPPELERFVAEAIAAGRYRDLEDVVRTGVRLVRQLGAERAGFLASLREAEAEAARVGRVSLERVDAADAARLAAAAPAPPGRAGVTCNVPIATLTISL